MSPAATNLDQRGWKALIELELELMAIGANG